MALLLLLGGMLVLLGLGFGARRAGVLTSQRTKRLNAFAYYVALPALIVAATHDQPLSEVVSARLLVGVVAVLLTTAAVAAAAFRRVPEPAARSVAVVQSYHTNLGYLGVPVVAATFDAATTAAATVILAAASLCQILLTTTVLGRANGAATDVAGTLRTAVANPPIGSVGLGLGLAALDVALPSLLATGLDLLGELALPTALLCVGATLTLEAASVDVRTVGTVVALKVVAMPLVALAAFALLGASATALRAGVAMFAMPTAVSTYVFAAELGGDRQLASATVFATTVASVASLLVVLTALRTFT